MNEITIKKANLEDEDFLWDMLYEAIYVEDGQLKPSRELLNEPAIQKYVEGWGKEGDEGFIAYSNKIIPIGAAWVRFFSESTSTYGYLEDDIPVLSMAINEFYRGKGIGSALLKQLLVFLKEQDVKAVSLSVDPQNPALRLYERFGFVKVGIDGTSWNMKVEL